MADKVEVAQPKFEPVGYQTTAQNLLEQILTMSGFTLQTFGAGQANSRSIESTATEVEARERLTFLTRGRFIRTQTPHLSRIMGKLLAVDKAIFNTPNVDAPIWVEFPDSVQESMLRLAQTVQTLFTAEAASKDQTVRILHPDWNDDMWDEEVAKIKSEFAPSVTDPMSLPPEKPGQIKVGGVSKDANSIT
jgi:hypothetical protein